MIKHRFLGISGLLILQFGLLTLISLWIIPQYQSWHGFDLQHYHRISLHLQEGLIPYRDFLLEYPPLALIPILIPQLFSPQVPLDSVDYAIGFMMENLILTSLLGGGLALIPHPRRQQTLIGYLVLTVLLAPLLPWRYDLFPALLTLGGLLGIIFNFPLFAGIALGLGIATKLYPVVLLPLWLFYFAASRDWGGVGKLGLGAIATTVASFAPFWYLAGDRFTSFLTYHQDRGLQIESTWAGLISLGHILGLTEASSQMNYGAQHIVSHFANVMLTIQPILGVVIMGVIYSLGGLIFRQEFRQNTHIKQQTLVVFSLAALLGFILANKVFSPQYLIWLLPFVPLLRSPTVALVSVSFALTTTVSFVTRQLRLMYVPSVVMLNLRNLILLVVLLAIILTFLKKLTSTQNSRL
ncbi:MAG: glycosyltransferase 87 family protein [Phormidium sp.]